MEIRDLDNLLKFGLVSGDKPHSPKSIPMKDVMRKNFQTINAISKANEVTSHKLYRLNQKLSQTIELSDQAQFLKSENSRDTMNSKSLSPANRGGSMRHSGGTIPT